jgi:hypothetical protein
MSCIKGQYRRRNIPDDSHLLNDNESFNILLQSEQKKRVMDKNVKSNSSRILSAIQLPVKNKYY